MQPSYLAKPYNGGSISAMPLSQSTIVNCALPSVSSVVVQQPATVSYSSYAPSSVFAQSRVLRRGENGIVSNGTDKVISKPVTSKEFARDTTCSIVDYFQIKNRADFLDAVEQVIEQVKLEDKCLQYGFTICGDKAFCRSSYTDAEGILVHFQNIDFLLKEGLCNHGDLLWLQLHGPPEELAKLAAEPMIQEMNVEFYELVSNSFKVEYKQDANVAEEKVNNAQFSVSAASEPVQAKVVETVPTPINAVQSFPSASVVRSVGLGTIVQNNSFVPPVSNPMQTVVRTNSYVPPVQISQPLAYTPPPPARCSTPARVVPMAASSLSIVNRDSIGSRNSIGRRR